MFLFFLLEEKTDTKTVYNLQDVEDNHNFYANDILVHNRCFVAGTKVFMFDGSEKNIEDVIVGDEVWSYNWGEANHEISSSDNPHGYNPEVAEKVGRKVTNTQNFTGSIVAEITFDVPDDTIEGPLKVTCTLDHPFFRPNGVLASVDPDATSTKYSESWFNNTTQLVVGDEILSTIGNATVTEIKPIYDDGQDTYIITVDETHNFYANQILVHNK